MTSIDIVKLVNQSNNEQWYETLKEKTVCAIHRTNVLQIGNIDKFYASTKLNKPGTVCIVSFLWRHNGRDGVSNHQPYDCLLNRLFSPRSKKTSKLRVTGLCAGNSLVTGEFPAQMTSNAENVSIWWRHHVKIHCTMWTYSILNCTADMPSG